MVVVVVDEHLIPTKMSAQICIRLNICKSQAEKRSQPTGLVLEWILGLHGL